MVKFKNFFRELIKPCDSDCTGTSEDLEKVELPQEQKIFTFQTLICATNNLKNKLGEGGFGPVFKGKLEDGREIAVKKLSETSKQGKREFTNEAKLLACIQHRNVVSLLGYCAFPEKLLVYEYVVNESLDKLLFKSAKRNVLNWKRRYSIIVGVAQGLVYLHEDSHDRIIHRDIKASNILLDNKWRPKIADFGMARLYPEDRTHVNTRVAGTDGYMAPEYALHGNLSVKADVYSFGVVVLELISGHKNSTFNLDPDCQNLLDWAYKLYEKGKGVEIMDSTLATSADPNQVATCIQIGLLCTQSDPKLRPTMRQVAVTLSKQGGPLDKPTRPGYQGIKTRKPCRPSSSSSSTANSNRTNSLSSRSTTTAAGGTTSTWASSSNAHHNHPPTSSFASSASDPYGKRPVKEHFNVHIALPTLVFLFIIFFSNKTAMATQGLATQYPELIFAAIKAIDEKNGANKSAISKHIETNSGNLPAAHSTLLSHHLNKMKAAGQLIIVKNNYVKPDADAPPRRGRGRPPKSKEALLPDTAVVSPAKPRGRPPKAKESPAPTTSEPTVSGRKRGRPPKLGSSVTKAPPPPASGERRGRGRPSKVKAPFAAPVGA
ncbi:hypothetical protein L1987_11080 [Smallanthus sonchifolius]|uniref:Uncharacterized protein n=1 Tax=Smallanthus sonchifolius TaxID=185202 RepID=A0ACB9JC57_9ASTR|nr:hypothetical protein L1987_11080 [Smallanthus sonchifolius]